MQVRSLWNPSAPRSSELCPEVGSVLLQELHFQFKAFPASRPLWTNIYFWSFLWLPHKIQQTHAFLQCQHLPPEQCSCSSLSPKLGLCRDDPTSRVCSHSPEGERMAQPVLCPWHPCSAGYPRNTHLDEIPLDSFFQGSQSRFCALIIAPEL